jgi:hypothetical protein
MASGCLAENSGGYTDRSPGGQRNGRSLRAPVAGEFYIQEYDHALGEQISLYVLILLL